MTYHPDFIATAIKMFSALFLVLGIFLGAFYLLRRFVKRDGVAPGRKFINIIDRTYIGVKKSVTLVEVAGKILVLGVTNDHISLLTQIEDQDSIEQLKTSNPAGVSMSFASHLTRMLSRVKEGKPGKGASTLQV